MKLKRNAIRDYGIAGIGVLLYVVFLTRDARAQECTIADPQSHTLSWDAPTQYENGNALGSDLDGFYVYYGAAASRQYTHQIDVTTSTATTHVLDCLAPRTTYYVAMTAYVPCGIREWATCEAGETRLESTYTGELTFTTAGAAVLPMPPVNLTISDDRTAYAILESTDNVQLLPVGVVAADTPCNPEKPVLGKYVVPRESVIWYGSTRPKVVVADCSG